jgi:hypothetical protein
MGKRKPSCITDSKKKELDRLVVLMIACDFQPFSIVNDSGFKDLVKALDPKYSLPSKTTVRNKLLPEFVNEQRRKLEDILHEVKYVSLTTDMWNSIIGESYITTTCHFIYEGEVKSAVLETIVIEENHTAERIKNYLEVGISHTI